MNTRHGCLDIVIDVYSINDNSYVITSRPEQNGRHFSDAFFKLISLDENCCISIQLPLTCMPKGPLTSIGSDNSSTPNHYEN